MCAGGCGGGRVNNTPPRSTSSNQSNQRRMASSSRIIGSGTNPFGQPKVRISFGSKSRGR